MAKEKEDKVDKKVKRIVNEKTTEFLEHHFSEEELRDMSQEMAKETIIAKAVKEKKASVDKDFNAQIEEANLKANNLATKIQNKSEYRNIACMKELDFKTGMVKITRVDTGEVVKERKMNDGEKQMTITGFEKD